MLFLILAGWLPPFFIPAPPLGLFFSSSSSSIVTGLGLSPSPVTICALSNLIAGDLLPDKEGGVLEPVDDPSVGEVDPGLLLELSFLAPPGPCPMTYSSF